MIVLKKFPIILTADRTWDASRIIRTPMRAGRIIFLPSDAVIIDADTALDTPVSANEANVPESPIP